MKMSMIVVAAICAIGCLALPGGAAAAPPPCTPNGAPPSDINSYLVLAKDHFETKGGDANSGFFLGGNIGVSNSGGTLEVGANHRFIMDTDKALVSDSSKIGDHETKAGTIWTNTITNPGFPSANVTYAAGPFCIPSFPVVSNFPGLMVFSFNGDNRPIGTGTTESLDPGIYGDIDVKNGATLILGDGAYHFNSLGLGQNATIQTTDKTIVNVRTKMSGGGSSGANYGTSNLTRWFVGGEGVPNNENAVNFSVGGSTVRGTFTVFDGEIALGNDTQFFGRIWGVSMHSDQGIDMTYEAPESVSGTKYLGNADGSSSGQGLAGFTFYVDVNGNGVFDQTEPSAVSGADGKWSIGPLYLTGPYNVREVGQPGYSCTFPGNCSYSVNLGTSGQDHGGLDFVNKPPQDCTTNPNLPQCQPPCVPGIGQNANCQPVTPSCVPKAGEDKDCRPIADTSKLSGLGSGCVKTSTVRVNGTNIAKVVFKIDGKTVKTAKKAPYRYLLKTKNYKVGAHKFTATTYFKSGKRTTKTLTFQHCKQKPKIKFTG